MQILRSAGEVLGEAFKIDDNAARIDLMQSVGPALGLIDEAHLSQLPTARRLAALDGVSDTELDEAECWIERIEDQSRQILALSQAPAWAARLRLYARVASWMKDHARNEHAIETCPVCQGAMTGKLDEISGKPVVDHLRELLGSETEFLEKTTEAWCEWSLARLRSEIADALAAEMSRELPTSPAHLIRQWLAVEFFEAQPLRGCLAVLQKATDCLCDQFIRQLPPFEEPPLPTFGELHALLIEPTRRLSRTIAFVRWRRFHASACKLAAAQIVGGPTQNPATASGVESTPAAAPRPLLERLKVLQRLVYTAEPVSAALELANHMGVAWQKREQCRDRIRRCETAAQGIPELLELPKLVKNQVGSLMTTLANRMTYWKQQIHSPAFVGAPTAQAPQIGSDGALAVAAAAHGAQAAAQHIANTAELRASLFAFFLAFWEHVLETRGGLAILLLDDPQEWFDPPNRRRLANAIPILSKKANIVVATLDPEFARQICAASARELGAGAVDHRRIHPPNSIRPYIVLGTSVDSVEEKLHEFDRPENENVAEPARAYISELRCYLENRLTEFFDGSQPGLPKQFTLSDLVNAIRSRLNTGIEPFREEVFQAMVSAGALSAGSEFLTLMNESHHGRHEQIQYNHVRRVRDDCVHVTHLVASAHEAYERWLRRDPPDAKSCAPVAPVVIALPRVEVPIFENLAAFTTDCPPGEVMGGYEPFSTESLSTHHVFVVSTNNLGFAAPYNCRALVNVAPEPALDNSLVIALHNDKVYARRVHRDSRKPGFVVLSSDATDPTKRPPSIVLPAAEVTLLRIVGILFDERPQYPRATAEAISARDTSCFDRIKLAFRVRGDSALPLALPGQIVLGGKSLEPGMLPQSQGHLVAVCTSTGEAMFKRIGEQLPGAQHVRHLEAVGGTGSSTLVRTESLEEDRFHDVPLVRSAREILGVIYT